MDDKLKTEIDKARERFQTERVALHSKTLTVEERTRRAGEIRKAEQQFWESLGEDGQGQVLARIEELEPTIIPTHPRQLGSNAPVEVEWSGMDEYYFLRRLAKGE
jgi:hypothetical protein